MQCAFLFIVAIRAHDRADVDDRFGLFAWLLLIACSYDLVYVVWRFLVCALAVRQAHFENVRRSYRGLFARLLHPYGQKQASGFVFREIYQGFKQHHSVHALHPPAVEKTHDLMIGAFFKRIDNLFFDFVHDCFV